MRSGFKKVVFLSAAIFLCFNRPAYEEMDSIALEAGTDKSSSWHHYTKVYSQYFNKYRSKPIKFLEIGIFHGDSVKLWEKYFPHAELHFIDIRLDHVRYFSNRANYHIADQGNSEGLEKLIKEIGGEFDIIIDDGGHTMNQQIVSFKTLFPHLKKHGIYVIEDLHTSYWSGYGGGGSMEEPKSGPGTTINFLKNRIDDLNFAGARTACADHGKASDALLQSLNRFQRTIYSMHFYDSLCLIIKR